MQLEVSVSDKAPVIFHSQMDSAARFRSQMASVAGHCAFSSDRLMAAANKMAEAFRSLIDASSMLTRREAYRSRVDEFARAVHDHNLGGFITR